jgi:hypothetical protein
VHDRPHQPFDHQKASVSFPESKLSERRELGIVAVAFSA